MHNITKVVKWVVLFLYRITGVQWAISEIDIRVSAYRIRLNIVPVSYKLFILVIGMSIGSSAMFVYLEAPETLEMLTSKTVVIEQAQAKEAPVSVAIKEAWSVAEFSAYTASVDETDASPLIMASGKEVYIGAIACPRDIKLGTTIEVKGHGVYVCEDRMNARYTNHFDLFMLTKAEAREFGRKSLQYKIIN